MRYGYGGSRKVVAWAIRQMKEDYDLHDIGALLAREGCRLETAKISVVLSRMKANGTIEEVAPGHGRRGAIFRKPGGAGAMVANPDTDRSVRTLAVVA
jgi:hypothetical protein